MARAVQRAVRGKRAAKAQRMPAKRARVAEEDSEGVVDARDMVSDSDSEMQAMQFLSHATLPDVATPGAQAKERKRLAHEKKQQREQLNALHAQRYAGAYSSDVSTDMEGLSEGSDKDLDEDSPGASDLEDAYLRHAAKRIKREERVRASERERNARRRLPVRDEDGALVDPSDSALESELDVPESRVVFSEEQDSEPEEAPVEEYVPGATITYASRFGHKAPFDLACGALANDAQTRAAALSAARDQIASLASQIVSDPENGINLLRRLMVFVQKYVPSPPGAGAEKKRRARIHPFIRQLALLSLLAVYIDIIPGYRIRALSELEEKEKVGQDVARRRDFEQTLVKLYRVYLETCEKEIKDASPLSPVALKSFCTLLTRASHFNFRKNILAVVVAHLSKRTWTAVSEQCYAALATLLAHDTDGHVSLETVMLLYRMIRERKFAVHANVLDILAHLRLRDELGKAHRSGPMGSASVAKKRAPSRKTDPKAVRKGTAVHVNKKQVKRNKEIREIEAEMHEAEASVDVEERARNQSETLKLVFALYFRLLKTPAISQQLLAAAIEGIVLFAHHVSIDFFHDLIQVLRALLAEALVLVDAAPVSDTDDLRAAPLHVGMRAVLYIILGAFELLAGQGEALQIDIADFSIALYRLLLPLSMSTCFEEEAALAPGPAAPKQRSRVAGLRRWSEAQLLFHAMDIGLIKAPRQSVYTSVDRNAAILKRLFTAALQWPTGSALRALQLAHTILTRTAIVDARFETLLDNRESVRNGQYDPLATIPESARVLSSGEPAWELLALRRVHANAQVRETAGGLLNWVR
ncbi:hypothetical protein MVES1_001592 [Malassezia vespertilionis]|uniref:Nucleolar complex-associated protein 3 n=1 Tax=Malassezia vespertilionis TaxID=2020962 RepID=A0A2N1JD20_9BASI|nr:uncharacterized protein MVES1_001592 [Malassezia vespertilionis]PKI84445.1 hypothetical protein MVES_001499 [Malassezia vespertilionis]WFD06247.1 hypothetical protein MVES1_001592 [Malassezia vespertilionis]